MNIEIFRSVYDFHYETITNFFLSRGVAEVTTVGFYMIVGVLWITTILTPLFVLFGVSSTDQKEREDHIMRAIVTVLVGWATIYALCNIELYVFETRGWIYLLAALFLGAAYRYRKYWLRSYYRQKAPRFPARPAPILKATDREIPNMCKQPDATTVQMPPMTASKAPQTSRTSRKQTAMDELDALIGLADVKKQVRNVAAFAKVQRQRVRNGLKAVSMGQHMVFIGSPGTGKTTVARIIGELYREAGLLSSGEVVEVMGRDLVGQFVGETDKQVKKIVEKSIGKVLFIDEAYILVPKDSRCDYGPEAVATLLKLMEDYRDQFIVIIAGYEKEIDALLRTNPGMKSRFKNKIRFEDYAPAELLQIFEGFCRENSYGLTGDARVKAERLFSDMYAAKDKEFGNGRAARNVFELCLMRQAARIYNKNKPSKHELLTLSSSDIPALAEIKL